MSITQKQLIDSIAHDFPEGTTLNKTQVQEALQRLGAVVASALAQGKEVALPGIGKLKPAYRAGRQGRNPRTGETIQIAAKTNVKLVVSKGLSTLLNP